MLIRMTPLILLYISALLILSARTAVAWVAFTVYTISQKCGEARQSLGRVALVVEGIEVRPSA
jgi:hypothetical protein